MAIKIFLSYSRTNHYIAERLHTDLTRAGCQVWWDQRSIPWGERWLSQIEQGIAASDTLFYLWSPEASQSPYVKKEIELFQKTGQPLKVLRIAGSESDMEDGLDAFQTVNLSADYWQGLHQVLETLKLPPLVTPVDLLHRNTLALEARRQLGDPTPREWTIYPPPGSTRREPWKFVRIPWTPKAYATSWLVAEQGEPLSQQGPIYVVFDFSGCRGDNIVEDVLCDLCRNQSGPIPQLLYLEGPTNSHEQQGKDRPVYRIPDDKPHVWRDGVDLAVAAIKHVGGKREAHFFMDAPVALIFPVAAKLRELAPYNIYNLDRNPAESTSQQKYRLIFSGP